MPNQPRTPSLTVRVPAEVQAELRKLAEDQETTVTELVNAAIREYLDRRQV